MGFLIHWDYEVATSAFDYRWSWLSGYAVCAVGFEPLRYLDSSYKVLLFAETIVPCPTHRRMTRRQAGLSETRRRPLEQFLAALGAREQIALDLRGRHL